MPFGVSMNDIIVADRLHGGFVLTPVAYEYRESDDSWPAVTIEGFIAKQFKAKENKAEQLRRFSLLDLMDEVGRRIKTGENKKESVRKLES